MPTENVKDEIFLLFERSVIPKLEIKELAAPKTIGCIVSPGEYGFTALETGQNLAKRWGSKIQVYSWVRYYDDVQHIISRAVSEELLLEQKIKEKYNIEQAKPVMSPTPSNLQKVIAEVEQKQGRSVDLMLRYASEGSFQLLTVPVPLFGDEEHKEDTLGAEVEILFRKTPRSLPICLVPHQTTGDEHTVVVVVHPDIIAPLTSRILQLFDEKTNVVLVAVLDPKLVDLLFLMRSEPIGEGSGEVLTKEAVEDSMKQRFQGFMEQMVATLRGKVNSTKMEIVTGTVGLTISNMVDTHQAANVLVYSRASEEDLLDPEVDIIGRLVPKTRIFIVWN